MLVEPLIVAEKSAQQALKIQQRLPWLGNVTRQDRQGRGRRAMVLGAGAVGLLGAMILQKAGFETYVYALSPAPNPRSRLVESIGAKYISGDPESADQVERLIGKVDVVYEAAGDPKLAVDMLKLLNNNSICILTGVPGQRVALELDRHRRLRDLVLKNQVIVGIVNAGKESFMAAIHDLDAIERHWPQALDAIVESRVPLSSYRHALLGPSRGIKTVLAIGSST